ncbi:lytic transglycosylase domain-containing protein [Ammoniphilus resinae]|uniref:Transglycosylase SLT domain-containing protein n=1 Tax=Ammoniphilus resinae TaxID=861532 RepID=A0ABS4GLM6_9BACL|nr:lytic transglycosylase domain-containing protein [Ammoniphilus resinae]MBP1931170.1 hypothetical protein [Ammoniphilus resinae]
MSTELSGVQGKDVFPLRKSENMSTVPEPNGTTSPFQELVDKHLDEIARSQVAFAQYKQQGRMDLAQGAHNWAEKQRAALQYLGVNKELFNPQIDLTDRFVSKHSIQDAAVYDYTKEGNNVRSDYKQWMAKVGAAYESLSFPAAALTSRNEVPQQAPAQVKPKELPVPKIWESVPERIKGYLQKVAEEVDVDLHLLAALAKQESGFQENARSRVGAIGLFQLMPSTARSLGVNPYDSYQNALGGAKYIKGKLDKYNGDIKLALAAYNAGPGRVDRAITKAGTSDWDTVSQRLPKETRNFVPKVLSSFT